MPEYTASVQEFVRVNWLFLIPLFPAIGAFINLIFGKKIQAAFGKKAIHTVAIGMMVLSALTAWVHFLGLLLPLPAAQRFLLNEVWPMLDLGAVRINFAFAMDPLSGLMAVMVTSVATAIHIYSAGYMHDEPSYWRFFGYLNLFCFSMLTLVLGDNLILMFFGWEGVGLCSYLLIGFWFNKSGMFKEGTDNAKAGMKAFVVNRIGDFGFIIGMTALFWGLLGMWDAVDGEQTTLKDGRCMEVQVAPMPLPHHGAAKAGGHAALPSIISVAHASGGEGHGKAAHGAGGALTKWQWSRCGAEVAGVKARRQPGIEVGKHQQLYLGPTVNFREIKDQLSVQNGAGDRVVAQHLQTSTLFGISLLLIVTLGLFLGATGKSAQIPIYIWLPDAMAGPTPVSALIHAATMVTAGVYMVARLNFIFIMSPGGMTVVAIIGALTAVFAATIGLFQNDIKKVLAYSTVSQLGYMFIGVGVGAYWVAIYHLLTHAFFKACLFLGSGSVIHGMHYVAHHHDHGDGHGHDSEPIDLRLAPDPTDPQDMRNMGGLAKLMPQTRITYLISCFAIAGIPFFSGFYSKDEILWKAFSTGNLLIPGWIIWGLGAAGALCTAFYMFRSYYLTFHGKPATEAHNKHVHESPRSMVWVLWFLAGGAVLMSLIGSYFFIPTALLGTHPWIHDFLAPVTALSDGFQQPAAVTSHAWEYGLMAFSVVLAATGILAARFLYKDVEKTGKWLEELKHEWKGIHTLIFNKYFVDELYAATWIKGFMASSRALAWFDFKVVDGAVNAAGWVVRTVAALTGAIDRIFVDGAVNGVATVVLALGGRARKIQTGRVNTYVTAVAFGVVILLFIVWFITPAGAGQ